MLERRNRILKLKNKTHMKRLAHFLFNLFMILIVSVAMFIVDLVLYLIKSIRETYTDTVGNIKYAYNEKFKQI